MNINVKITFVLMLMSSMISKADQFVCLDSVTVKKAYDLLSKQKAVYIYCACCDNEKPEFVKVEFINTEKNRNGYEIVLKGTARYNEQVNYLLDLAYVFIQKKNNAVNLAIEMGLKCNPCKDFFPWVNYFNSAAYWLPRTKIDSLVELNIYGKIYSVSLDFNKNEILLDGFKISHTIVGMPAIKLAYCFDNLGNKNSLCYTTDTTYCNTCLFTSFDKTSFINSEGMPMVYLNINRLTYTPVNAQFILTSLHSNSQTINVADYFDEKFEYYISKLKKGDSFKIENMEFTPDEKGRVFKIKNICIINN
jgi:hypothetical protein